jgi:signal transduction histidine kinase
MIRRLVMVSILVFGALLGLGVFGMYSIVMHEEGLEGRRFGEFTAVAGQIRTEVRRSLNDFLAAEQVRPYTDYQYFFVPQAANNIDISAMVRSPLGDGLSHGLAFGYFQINPDSTVSTPHALADASQAAPPPVRDYLTQLKPLLTRLGEPGKPISSPGLLVLEKKSAQPPTKTKSTQEDSLEQPLASAKGKQTMDRSGKFAVIEPQEQQKAVTVTQNRANVEQNLYNANTDQQQSAPNQSADSSYGYQQGQRGVPQSRQQGRSATRRDANSQVPLRQDARQQSAPSVQSGQPRDQQQRLVPQQSAGQVPAAAQQSDQVQIVRRMDAEPVQMQTQQQMESQQFLSQQVQTAGPQQAQQDLVQIRIEPIVPVWVSEPKSDLPFKGQVYFVRHVQFEQTHLMQGFRLDQASLLGVIRDATDRLLRRGMGYSLNPADSERAAYTAFLDFGFGELPLNLLELDPGGIARDMGRLRSIYSIIFGVVFAATVAAIFGLGRGLTEQLRLSRKKDDFLSAVSHELRTPLTTIRMYTEMLEKDWVRTESKRNEYYGIMRQESERLTRLIENVLDFSRIQRGRKQYAFKAGDFNRIVGDVIEMMTPCAQRAGFTIRRDLQYIESFCFDSDAVMQIVINLLDNAIKYARGADDKTIFIRTKTDGKIVQIEVEDRGPGIPRNERAKIFEEFYRIGDESRRETTGTGLGLALVKRFAEAHRGSVAVFAANPCGALFRVGLSVKA